MVTMQTCANENMKPFGDEINDTNLFFLRSTPVILISRNERYLCTEDICAQ